MKPHVQLRKLMSVFVTLLIGLSGCGVSEYEKRMDEQRKRVKEFDEMNKLLDNPIDIPSMQIPTPAPNAGPNAEPKIEQAWKFDVFLRLPKGFGPAVSANHKIPYKYPFPCFRYTGGGIAYDFFVAAATVVESSKDETFRDYTSQSFRTHVKQAMEDFLLKSSGMYIQLEKRRVENVSIKEFSPLSTLPDEPERTIPYEAITYAPTTNPMNKDAVVFQAYFHESFGRQVCIVVHRREQLANPDAFTKSMDACLGSLDLSPLVASRRAHFLKTRQP